MISFDTILVKKIIIVQIIIFSFLFVTFCSQSAEKYKKNLPKPDILEIDDASFNPKTGEYIADKYTVGLWHLNEGEDILAFDSSQFDHTAELQRVEWGQGVFSQCLLFKNDGVVDIMDDEDFTLSPSHSFTIEFWLQITQEPKVNIELMSKRVVGVNQFEHTYRIAFASGKDSYLPSPTLWLLLSNKERQAIVKLSSVTSWRGWLTSWNYYAFTYNGESVKIYVNGKLLNKKDMTGTLNYYPSSVLIGSGLNGMIDEIRISHVARSEKAIKAYWKTAKGFIK